MSSLWLGVLPAALVALFAAGTAAALDAGRVAAGAGPRRRWSAAAAAVTLLANVALYRHDVHFDITRSHAFTPAPEAQRVIDAASARTWT